MYIKVILGIFFAISVSVIFTTTPVHASCVAFEAEEFDPREYDSIFIGEPILENLQTDRSAQLIKATKVYKGSPRSSEWFHFSDVECSSRPSKLHTSELYLTVQDQYLFDSDYRGQPWVRRKFAIDSDEYKVVLKSIEANKRKGLLKDPKIEELTVRDQKDEVEAKMRILIDELTLLLKEYKYFVALETTVVK